MGKSLITFRLENLDGAMIVNNIKSQYETTPTKVGTLFTQCAKKDERINEYFKEVSIVSKEIINAIFDGDLHTRLKNVEFSTSPREVITVGEMMEGIE